MVIVCMDLDISVGKTVLAGVGGAKIGIFCSFVSVGPKPTLVLAFI